MCRAAPFCKNVVSLIDCFCNGTVYITFVTGELCHRQHQEMRVRREVGTDEPIEVVEVEQNYDAAHVPKCVFTQS